MIIFMALLLIGEEEHWANAAHLGSLFKANYAIASGDYTRALQLLEQAIAKNSIDPEAAFLKVEVLARMPVRAPMTAQLRQKNLQLNLTHFMELFPSDYRFPMALGVHLINEPMLLKESLPHSPDFYLNLSLRLINRNDANSDEVADIQYYLGLWYYRKEDFFQAAEAFKQVVQQKSTASWAWYYAARSLEGSHQLRSALTHYRKYLELAGTDPITFEMPVALSVRLLQLLVSPTPENLVVLRDWLSKEDTELLYYRAVMRLIEVHLHTQGLVLLQGMPAAQRGLNYYRLLFLTRMHLHQYGPLYEEIRVGMKLFKKREARAYLVEFAIEAALHAERYSEILQLRLEYNQVPGANLKLDLYTAFAQVLNRGSTTQWDQVVQTYRSNDLIVALHEEVKKSSLRAVALAHIVQLYMEWSDWEKAQLYLELFYIEEPKQAKSSDDLAVIYFLMGKYAASFVLYERLIAVFPQRDDLLNNYGYFLAETGQNLDRARTLLREVVARNRENGSYLDSMGWVYYKLGNYVEAEHYLLKSQEEQDNDPEKLEHLGDLYFAMGRVQDARKCWAMAMDGAIEHYLRILDKLDPAQ